MKQQNNKMNDFLRDEQNEMLNFNNVFKFKIFLDYLQCLDTVAAFFFAIILK